MEIVYWSIQYEYEPKQNDTALDEADLQTKNNDNDLETVHISNIRCAVALGSAIGTERNGTDRKGELCK